MEMVEQQLAAQGITDTRVLDAMATVPRHLFVPENVRSLAYDDTALPIEHGQTISQPYIVAFMTEALALKSSDKVLEIGTGSGYQAAVLSKLVKAVYSVEILEPLAKSAARLLAETGSSNVHVRVGNGYKGWPEQAPFDAVIVTAAPEQVPQALIEQLAEGGRLVVPVGKPAVAGSSNQQLLLLRKHAGRIERESLLPVAFVPMTGDPR